jgi:hypothetical protein
LIVCLRGYATYLNDHSTLTHHDRGGIHPTTIYSAVSVDIVVIVSLPAGQIGLTSTAVVATQMQSRF